MRQLFFKLFAITLKLCLLFSITLANAEAAVSDITRIYHQTPTLEGFDVCFGGGCAEIKQVSLSPEEWRKVKAVFTDINNLQMSSEQERKKIANAIGVLETIVGLKIGTNKDIAGTFNNASYPGQLDCNDEAINTTSYMRLMRENNLIKLHEIEDMRTRNFFFTGWPHTTAVMHETATGQRFAVDSWFYDNGIPATIVPFDLWKSGYIPVDSPLSHSHQVHQSSE
ncbi:MAG: hypothetical protein ABIP37_03140 [Methylotenera sp.]